ncbi:unnamed protein product [Brassicogethes aeneus]|uniref:PARP catalytic domain-containing protein n=1 Tax=Brassicogethes aeneus TaxID=1431903 RepID=A0A9P0FGT0_BRAAE|nr:unnamed protein product [Brassicogethes aeneus]
MIYNDLAANLPENWFPMDFSQKYQIFPLEPYTTEFDEIYQFIKGNYYKVIQGIFKLQNPCLHAKYTLKLHEYTTRGPFTVKKLFHDTDQVNVESIACYNFDWRLGRRFKYGPGVYFSDSPYLANKHSWKEQSHFRSMFVVDVLIQNVQTGGPDIFLPDIGFDTVKSLNGATYVKYFDNEYYPTYFVNYLEYNSR